MSSRAWRPWMSDSSAVTSTCRKLVSKQFEHASNWSTFAWSQWRFRCVHPYCLRHFTIVLSRRGIGEVCQESNQRVYSGPNLHGPMLQRLSCCGCAALTGKSCAELIPSNDPSHHYRSLCRKTSMSSSWQRLEDWRRPKCCEDIHMESGILVQSIQTAM